MTYIPSAKRIMALILGAIAGFVGVVLLLIVVWSALTKGQARLLLNGIFPVWAVVMGIWGIRYGLRNETADSE